MSITYKESGVDIEAGNHAVFLIKDIVADTFKNSQGIVLTKLGGFSGAVELPGGGVIAATTDGVGTKVRIAQVLNKHNTIGIDLVAMCVNDLAVGGLTPILFQDYIAMGKQKPERTVELVGGMALGCKQASMIINGGEMAEMPNVYNDDEYDLAGFAVGHVQSKEELITGERITPGMKVYGFPSSGLHSNGFGLVYKILKIEFSDFKKAREALQSMSQISVEELLKPTIIYVELIAKLRKRYDICGMIHVTGGGLVENPPRIMPKDCSVRINLGTWEIPQIFQNLQDLGDITSREMRRTFNMGLGLLVISSDEIKEGIEVGEIIESSSKDTQFVVAS